MFIQLKISGPMVVLLGVLSAPSASAQSGPVQVNFDLNLLPERVHTGNSFGNLHRGFQEGDPYFKAETKRLEISWVASALNNSEPSIEQYTDLGPGTWSTTDEAVGVQEIVAGFHITACGRLDEDALIVAGVDKVHGLSVIEKWKFIWPTTMPAVVTDPVSGVTSVDLVIPGVVKTSLYSESLATGATHYYITGVCGLRSAANSNASTALVHFDSPNDLFILDLTSSQLTLLASESSLAGALGALDSLSVKEYSRIGVRDHASLGYIYFFGVGNPDVHLNHGGASTVDDETVLLHLIDSDRDGIVDCAHEISTNQEEVEGAHDLDDYNDWWLE